VAEQRCCLPAVKHQDWLAQTLQTGHQMPGSSECSEDSVSAVAALAVAWAGVVGEERGLVEQEELLGAV